MPRCSTGGTRKPERSASASTAAASKARVTTATLAVSIVASSRAASGATSSSRRAVGAAGVASTSARAVTASGAAAEPTVSRQPSAARSPRGRWPRCGPRARRRAPRRAGPCRRRCPAKTGASEAGDGRRLLEQRAASRHGEELRHRGGGRDAARAAGVHASQQGLDEALDDLVAQPLGDQVAHRDVVVGGGADRSPRARASPASERTPLAASSSRSNGTPIRLRGSRRSAPRDHTREAAEVGCTTSIPRSAASATPSGRRASIASAPTSTVTPATSARRSLPPTSGRALEHEHVPAGPRPGRGRRSGRRSRHPPRRRPTRGQPAMSARHPAWAAPVLGGLPTAHVGHDVVTAYDATGTAAAPAAVRRP